MDDEVDQEVGDDDGRQQAVRQQEHDTQGQRRPEADEEAGVEEGDDQGQGPGEPGAARTLRRPPVAQEDDVDAEQLSAERDPQDGAGDAQEDRRAASLSGRDPTVSRGCSFSSATR